MEERLEYLAASAFRFLPAEATADEMRQLHARILSGESVDVTVDVDQVELFGT
jgi:hypothetical protein